MHTALTAKMLKKFWTCLVLVSIILVLTVASKKGGKGKTGNWGSSGNSRNPNYPGNTGSNWNTNQGNRGGQNPAYPGNPGGGWNQNNPGSNWNQGGGGGYHFNPGGSNYNKPDKKKKTNMKMVAGAAAVGVVGGFVLGNAMSNMRYSFDNDMEYRYYNSYHSQMPNQVYKPQYQGNQYVPEDRFVTDCFNTTMTEYVIKPNEAKNTSEINDTEVKVKSTIIRQMCITEYRRSPEYYSYNNSSLKLLFSSSLFFISLFVYFVVQ